MSSQRAGKDAGTAGEAASAVPGSRHLRRTGTPRLLKIIAIALSAVLVAGVGFAAVKILQLQFNVNTQPLNLGVGQEDQLPIDLSTDAVQILILGSDTRQGADNAKYGGAEFTTEQGNADVMMLLNMSADRKNVTMVSFPRDLLVPLPACTDPDTGETSEARGLAQLNTSLTNGGPGCTVAAINELTGLQIDHFMMADFKAVTELSKTLGGVEVCVNQAVQDEYSGLNLPAGTSEVEGEQALAFLRTRYGFGDGGDEGRIRAQQSFMASMARKIKEEGTFTNLPRMYAIAETITKNLTVDDGLSQAPELLKLADRLKDVDLNDVAFVKAPTEQYEPNPNRLVLDEKASEQLFQALRADRSLTAPEPAATPTGPAPAKPTDTAAQPSESPSEPVPTEETPPVEEPLPFVPADIPVTVLNATDDGERGEEILEILVEAGYTRTASESATQSPATQIFVGTGYEPVGTEIAELFGIGAAQVVRSDSTFGITVSVGTDFSTGKTIDAQGLERDLSGQTAAQVTCQSSSGN